MQKYGLVLLGCLAVSSIAWAAPPTVVRVSLDDEPITPVSANFIARSLREAERLEAQCVVLELNTPGGLVASTQEIVTDIIRSQVPVVVYVSPSGGRAASAGLFITLSSHVAAMSPGTRIGAAHPVQIGGGPIGPGSPGPQPESPVGELPQRGNAAEESTEPTESDRSDAEQDENQKSDSGKPSVMGQKVLNDMVAWARSLARMRDRNEQWVVLAVTASESITADEALERNVVELVAADFQDLMRQLDGTTIDFRPEGGETRTVTFETADAPVQLIEMWWGEQLLATLADPNLALILMMVGVYGILYELYSPGWGVGGTLGAISLVLAFFSASVLPINYAGLALITAALALLVAEVFVTSFGALAAAGIVCLILGGTMLVDSPSGFMRVSLNLLIPMAIGTGAIVVFLLSSVVRAQQQRVQTGGEGMLGQKGTVRRPLTSQGSGFRGQIIVHGELWSACSDKAIPAGHNVRVVDRDGLTLTVESSEI